MPGLIGALGTSAVNTLPLVEELQGGVPILGPSGVTDNGTTLAYKGTAIALVPSGPVAPAVLYSAAGTPLPAASNALKGARAIVSDATTPTYLGAYVSGGAVVAGVICTGAGWVTG